MPVVEISHDYTVGGVPCTNTRWYWHSSHIPTIADMDAMLEDFEDTVLPGINGYQMSTVVNQQLRGYLPNLGLSRTRDLSGGGLLAGGAADTVSASTPLLMRRTVGQTVLNDGGAVYTGNRPIRGGHYYLSGVSELAMQSTGWKDDSSIHSAYLALQIADVEVIHDADDRFWDAVVFGAFLEEASPSKPLRPFVVAPIQLTNAKGFKGLETRGG